MLLSSGIFLSSTTIFDQERNTVREGYENVRPFRIVVKSGIPNLLSGHIEYVLPLLNRKFAVSADYSKINMDTGDFGFEAEGDNEILEQEFDCLELGLHYYFLKREKVCMPVSLIQIMV
ncbi:hypothetical protein APR41_07395 [Salegentibacter salinarum]|uniref:Uncharacterized protein n=1 Tax=Salegentibacter salinarum TaxID=447422 RepID=A0A2N0TPG2_9FLAO|nr:hypothetical protein [Salegentibacter salinarum]PKD16627.1 hypothetical protein APR41_07395 [Salegentibacter salinarum]SKB61766.1 hypothetical protein SAMN05660903_01716 [Salegentibacter salinarum]